MGAVVIAPVDVVRGELSDLHRAVLLDIRLPRVVLAILVGAALACSGALLQGLFRNPLADPGLVGVSSGAALAAATSIVLGLPTQGFGLPVAAFIGGALATLFAAGLAQRDGHLSVTHLLLAGIAVNALCGAGVGMLIFAADDDELRGFTFWTLGSLGSASWSTVTIAAVGAGIPTLLSLRLARGLDVLLLGESSARALGLRLDPLKAACIGLAALAVGTSVALCGLIGFIGLVAPHLVRLAVGPRHGWVIPGAALLGAVLLLGSDLAARTVVAPVELPVGILTTGMGGPFLLWLLRRRGP
ncbi:MAG: iron ABC transporter permease [Myxococcales bacterium]|nr:iron ABC transporter permease [Myxococcales bacterium]